MVLLTKCSLQASLADLKQVACASFGLEEVDVQMFDYFTRKKYAAEPLDVKPDETIEGANLLDNQDILLEEKVSWPAPVSSTLPTQPREQNKRTLCLPGGWQMAGSRARGFIFLCTAPDRLSLRRNQSLHVWQRGRRHCHDGEHACRS